MADAFENKTRGIHLPHLVGTITNLDGAGIQRSLMSINSELKRRQAVFKRAKGEVNEGTMDIYDYQKLYRSKKVSEPMPHLFIISDEFAELKSQQPEFMNELISTARIGRSLGVHLILATQKPGGVVNDQILSNTKFRACLKVQDRSDSMEMLKRPDAAELKNTGRFYLQVGYNEYFGLGQSAWCGAEYTPQEEVQTQEDDSVVFLDNAGQAILSVKPPVKKERSGMKQIVAIVTYLSDLAKREGINGKALWLDPLPKALELDTVVSEVRTAGGSGMRAVIGRADDPERQSQFSLCIDMLNFHHMLLCGNAGCGKSTFLRTMLLNLVENYGPDELNYYLFDLSSGALNSFKTMPHCGAYITEQSSSDFFRLLDLIKSLIAQRKELFAEADVTTFEAYRAVKKLPLVLVVIDGYSNVRTLPRGEELYANMYLNLRDAGNYGIRYIFSANHNNEIHSRTKQEIDYRIALQAKDRYDYGDILETRCALGPSEINGRGVCVVEGRPLEYQVAVPGSDKNEQERANLIKERLQRAGAKYGNTVRAERLPVLETGLTYADFCAGFQKARLPLGYDINNLKPIALPFQQMYALSMYFGNPVGVKPVIENLFTAVGHNDMDIVFVRRQSGSVLDGAFQRVLYSHSNGKVTVLDTSDEGIASLNDLIYNEISMRNVYRDEYSTANGIPITDKGRAKKAARYIRERTTPLLVIFESFGDLCRQKKDENIAGELAAYISRTQGYNIYFVGCFYPNEEGNITGNALMKAFNKDEHHLLFGGQYDKQCITNLPMDLKKIEKVNPNYDRYVLKYQGQFHTMFMPCGELVTENADPDEAAIF